MFVCNCRNVTEDEIVDLVLKDSFTPDELRDILGIGANCGQCRPEVLEIHSKLQKALLDTCPNSC